MTVVMQYVAIAYRHPQALPDFKVVIHNSEKLKGAQNRTIKATTHVHKKKSSIILESILHSKSESLVSSEGPVG